VTTRRTKDWLFASWASDGYTGRVAAVRFPPKQNPTTNAVCHLLSLPIEHGSPGWVTHQHVQPAVNAMQRSISSLAAPDAESLSRDALDETDRIVCVTPGEPHGGPILEANATRARDVWLQDGCGRRWGPTSNTNALSTCLKRGGLN
jgi:hypothetical protein